MARYWFRPKKYGYGATPVTWEGWALTFATAAVVGGSAIAMNLLADRSNVVAWLLWAMLVAAASFWLMQISRRRMAVALGRPLRRDERLN